jgi:hypothetical protein
MERAWQARDQWQTMGRLAGQQIRGLYPLDPISDYADRILNIS